MAAFFYDVREPMGSAVRLLYLCAIMLSSIVLVTSRDRNPGSHKQSPKCPQLQWTEAKKFGALIIFSRFSFSTSSCRAISADISYPLSPPLPIVHFGRSSGLHPVSAQSCCMYIRAGRPAFARPCEGVHRSTSLTSSSLLLQQCPACLVRLILIVFVTGGMRPYSCCFEGCCHQDLFNIARSILV